MSALSKDDKVWYIPDHADGPEHRDAEAGTIVDVGPFDGYDADYLFDYNDGSGVAKLTYERHLQERNT